MNVNKPVTNPDLLAAIYAIQNNATAETEALFIDELKKAHLLSPAFVSHKPIPEENGTFVLQKDTTIRVFSIANADNESFLLAFTDWPELKKWRDEQDEQTIVFTYSDLSSMVMHDFVHSGFVINPYGCNIIITRDMIERFSNNPGHASFYTVEKETKVIIGTPSNYPYELTKAISDYLKKRKNVKGAYLVLMQKENESSFLIVVDFTGDRKETFDGIASVAVPLLKNGELIDMVPLEKGIGEEIANGYAPFYKRKLFGFF